MVKTNVTFVTSWIHIYKDIVFDNKTNDWRFENFDIILRTGIQICIFVSPDFYDKMVELAARYENLKIIECIPLEETQVYKICDSIKNDGIELLMPTNRHSSKDSYEYLVLINSKIQFIKTAIEHNPWNSTHFAWIDFSIAYVLRDKVRSTEYLKMLSDRTYPDKMLVVPGCVGKFNEDKYDQNAEGIQQLTKSFGELYNSPFWRFCGGFLLGDKESLLSFYDLYFEHFENFLREHRHIVWEVNYWAWLESTKGWSPTWYSADHNDSIFCLPARFYVKCFEGFAKESLRSEDRRSSTLSTEGALRDSRLGSFGTPTKPPGGFRNDKPRSSLDNPRRGLSADDDNECVKTLYEYPELYDEENLMLPSSSSYIFYEGKHILNTRFVNYSFTPEGRYDIRHPNRTLLTRNIRSYLDVDLVPWCYGKMSDETVELESYDRFSHGLEDMRLFEYDNKLYFVASNANYSPNDKIRIIMGEYNHNTLSYSNCRVLEPPTDTHCEKNWVPITTSRGLGFIYSWYPFRIGCLDENNKLEIISENPVYAPHFHKVRGSSIFVNDGDKLLGVVHFSEEGSIRKYYHMLVRLDPVSLIPLEYSDPFCFLHHGVEFCIGFSIYGDKYAFWASKKDNDATMILLDRSLIEMCKIDTN